MPSTEIFASFQGLMNRLF